jgi:hypothetical protein
MFNPSGLKGKDIYLYIWIFKFQIAGTVKILNRALVSIILPMLQRFLSLVHFFSHLSPSHLVGCNKNPPPAITDKN